MNKVDIVHQNMTKRALCVMSWHFQGKLITKKQQEWYDQLSDDEQERRYQSLLHVCKMKAITIVTVYDQAYPQLLRNISKAPTVLYVRGKYTDLNACFLSVVGSRKPHEYSRCVAQILVRQAVQHRYVVVSGLAQGIDSIAHEVAHHCGGRTVAVLAFGHDFCYPATQWHNQLKQLLDREQTVVSQYPPQTPIAKWRFIERNFLIATLSRAVVVIQAKQKSGSLITADMAVEAGRDVYIVTGVFGDDTYTGGIELIHEGAIACHHFSQIMNSYEKI